MAATLKEMTDRFQQACRERGLKVTPQRVEIFKALAQAEDHPSAERLHQRLQPTLPSLSLDTVYRTLGTFSEMGLIQKVETTKSQAHYEVSFEAHHHLICERCGKIIDFQWPQIDRVQLPETAQNFGRFEKRNVVVYGICDTCLKG